MTSIWIASVHKNLARNSVMSGWDSGAQCSEVTNVASRQRYSYFVARRATHAALPHRPSMILASSSALSTQHLHLPRPRSCANKL